MRKSDAVKRELSTRNLKQPDLPTYQRGYYLVQDTPLDRLRNGDRLFFPNVERLYTVVAVAEQGVWVQVKGKARFRQGTTFTRAVQQVPQGVPPAKA
jgi:hypothetical protein